MYLLTKTQSLCTELEEDDIVEVTARNECEQMAEMLEHTFDSSFTGSNEHWTRNCNYWAANSERYQKFWFNTYAGNNKGEYSQQACQKEVTDIKSP